jgi:ATP-dependent Clp protease ATP-binding subunit ClpC
MLEERADRVAGQRAADRPDLGDLDQLIAQARSEKESAIDAEDFDTAAVLRSVERQLTAVKAAREPEEGSLTVEETQR